MQASTVFGVVWLVAAAMAAAQPAEPPRLRLTPAEQHANLNFWSPASVPAMNRSKAEPHIRSQLLASLVKVYEARMPRLRECLPLTLTEVEPVPADAGGCAAEDKGPKPDPRLSTFHEDWIVQACTQRHRWRMFDQGETLSLRLVANEGPGCAK